MSPWSRMDRKASAVAEFTIRQYLARSSTWVVLGLAAGMMFVLLMFYASEMRSAVDPIDNDGDADDADGDGYVNGHEILAGTNPFDPSVFPDGDPMPASAFIDEDDYDWSAIGTGFASGDAAVSVSVGVDDDGDCWRNASATPPTNSSRDGSNQNGIPCDVLIEWSQFSQVAIVTGDTGVDEDPDDQRYYRESLHRAFIVGTGKVGFVFLLSVFIPLFLAAGLIREDMESGTIHYILSKPMGRGSIILARLLGYLGLTLPALAAIIGVMAPRDDVDRARRWHSRVGPDRLGGISSPLGCAPWHMRRSSLHWGCFGGMGSCSDWSSPSGSSRWRSPPPPHPTRASSWCPSRVTGAC